MTLTPKQNSDLGCLIIIVLLLVFAVGCIFGSAIGKAYL